MTRMGLGVGVQSDGEDSTDEKEVAAIGNLQNKYAMLKQDLGNQGAVNSQLYCASSEEDENDFLAADDLNVDDDDFALNNKQGVYTQ